MRQNKRQKEKGERERESKKEIKSKAALIFLLFFSFESVEISIVRVPNRSSKYELLPVIHGKCNRKIKWNKNLK